ncbi:NB-ARC domains-containing protein, partial [Tanacetum coccineum]
SSKNVEDLKRENKKLTQMMGRVQQQITVANNKGDRLLDGVEEWVANAECYISEAKEVIDRAESNANKTCFNLGMCTDLRTLYRDEDSNIPFERLAYYGVGLKIFKDLDSMEDARNRVRLAVKILKSTCLLLDGYDESTVKMHDVVREVALLLASKGSNKFLVKAGIGLTVWQPRTESVKSCTGISLMKNRIQKLPDYELDIPLLDIFLIQENDLSTVPDKFIPSVKEARVLDFKYNEIVSLPPSLKQLTKLCMLDLGGNESLCDISILGDLTSLEILILSHTGI